MQNIPLRNIKLIRGTQLHQVRCIRQTILYSAMTYYLIYKIIKPIRKQHMKPLGLQIQYQ